MTKMEMVVGGIQVHPLWMDVMEEVVKIGGLWLHSLRMDGIRNVVRMGGDEPPWAIEVMEYCLSPMRCRSDGIWLVPHVL
jgi:hypothetical protein